MIRLLQKVITLALNLFLILNSLCAQTDKFQAEGLTEPVTPKDREFAVKVTFPDDDFYMLFNPPGRAGYVSPEGIGTSNEWAETASNETNICYFSHHFRNYRMPNG